MSETLASVLTDGLSEEKAEVTAINADVEDVGDEQETEAKAQSTDEESPEGETPEQKHKRLSGYQRTKIKLQKTSQERDFWRKEALRNRPETEKQAAPPDELPKIPKLSEFQGTVEEYEKAVSDYPEKLRVALETKTQKAEIEKQASEAIQSFNERLRSYPEFEQMAQAVQDSKMDSNLLNYMERVAAPLKNGPEVIKEVLLDDDLRDQLLQLDRVKDGNGIAAQLHAVSAGLLIANRKAKAEAKENEPPPTTKAPKPPVPVRKPIGSTTGEPSDSEPAMKWIKWRENQLKNK
jgi:hypothetical protein